MANEQNNGPAPLSENRVWLEEYLNNTPPERTMEATSRFFMHLWEPTARAHDFTQEEMSKMCRYDSLDYAEPHNFVYREHLTAHEGEGKYLRWAVYGGIGIAVGIWGFVLFTTIETVFAWRRGLLERWILTPVESLPYVALMSFSIAFASAAVCVVVPAAAGSGVPEVMAYLNGVMFPRVFNIRTLLAKSLSTVLSVSSGLPVGAEGPMIHIGSLMAAGISSGRSRSLKWSSKSLSQFRNTKDARDFVTAGAAAGITFVFKAPIGGLLFIMEEVASFFPVQLAWMVFFCCLCCAFTEYVLSTYFRTWREVESHPGALIGDIPFSAMVAFGVVINVPVNAFAIIPSIAVGIVGGLLAVLFIMANLTVVRLRGRYIAGSTLCRVMEPCLVAAVYSTLVFWLASTWDCRAVPPFLHPPQTSSIAIDVFTAGCFENNTTKKHNSFATLSLEAGMDSITNMFNAPAGTFDILSLTAYLAVYFTFAALSSGMSISHGVLVPTVMIGAIMGRLIGTLLFHMFEKNMYGWGSPAMFAVLGTASFFSGTTRLTFSLAIIMLEMTNDLEHLIHVMAAIWTAKAVADQFTTSFVHGVLRSKCVPFLDTDVTLQRLDMHSVREVMTYPVVSLRAIERIDEVVRVLLSYQHHGFPIISAQGSFRGIVSRDQLEELLWFIILTSQRNEEGVAVNSHAPPTYEELREVREKIFWTRSLSATQYPLLRHFFQQSLDLNPYIDTSAVCVPEAMSISRTYMMFRSLNLRHLTVIDVRNEPVGIITRKDLVYHSMEAKLIRVQRVVVGRRKSGGVSPSNSDPPPGDVQSGTTLGRNSPGNSPRNSPLPGPLSPGTHAATLRQGSRSATLYSKTLIVAPHSPRTVSANSLNGISPPVEAPAAVPQRGSLNCISPPLGPTDPPAVQNTLPPASQTRVSFQDMGDIKT